MKRIKSQLPILSPIIAIASALLVSAILILIAGANPIAAYTALFQESLFDDFGFGNTLTKMTPLLFTSLGGAYLSLVQVKYFAEGMTAGKGFIAIAALIFGKWHPIGSSLASLLFGATEALQLRIQALGINIPYQFLIMLPYVVALLALIGLIRKSPPPAALGIPYQQQK